MKKIILLLISFILTTISFSQVTLSYKNNALLPGDSNTYREIQYVSPGNSGPNQIWDFSKIQFNGKTLTSRLSLTPSRSLNGVGEYNVLLDENEYEYFFNIKENIFEEKGCVSKDFAIVYSDPIVKMKYPFSFGDQINDKFSAVAFFQENVKIDITGDYSVTADAYGTLILPDRSINDALRVKIERKGLEINMCSSTETESVRYLWYVPGLRYPVLSISTNQYQTSGQEPKITQIAYLNPQSPTNGNSITNVNEPTDPTDNFDVPVIVYPNPFNEKVSYRYFLRKQLTVDIDLYDISGKNSIHLVKKQIESEGVHTGELDASLYGLTPGVYYIRFIFDKKVVIRKIVKV